MDAVAKELVATYHRLSDALARGDAEAASVEARSGGLAPDSPPSVLQSVARMFPGLASHDVAHAERIETWACLFLRTSSPDAARQSFRVHSFRREGGRWRAETGASEVSFERTGDAAADAARFAALVEQNPPDRPKPKPARSRPAKRAPVRARLTRPVCEAPDFLDAIRLTDAFVPSEPRAVDELERSLGCAMPACYREYVVAYGASVYAGFVRVYAPERVSEGLPAWRDRVREYYFWEASAELLDHERLVECVVIADTLDGDELVFHPTDPATLYVLPRHQDRIHVAGTSLQDALRWLTESGTLTAPIGLKYVETIGPTVGMNAMPAYDTTCDFAELSRDLLALGLHDARSGTDGDDASTLELVSRALGGVILILVVDADPPRAPQVQVTYDPAAPPGARSRVRDVLERHGYTIRPMG
ncbi:MAG: hypothetical protein AB7S26_12190 [Sandaracinaceae bacterium]